ncbi:MAG TPA: hypothetical protein VH186_06265 [Chloroflexia bacterium]|nr:hypothetical protein [Chloroflexia bacterium]
MDIQAKDIILLVGGAFLGLILSIFSGYFVNLTTPSLGLRIEKRREIRAQIRAKKSIEEAKTRIQLLEEDIRKTKEYRENSTKLYYEVFYGILRGLGLLAVGIIYSYIPLIFIYINDHVKLLTDPVILLISSIIFIPGFSLFLFAFLTIAKTSVIIDSVRNFPEYEHIWIRQIKELQSFVKDKEGFKEETKNEV